MMKTTRTYFMFYVALVVYGNILLWASITDAFVGVVSYNQVKVKQRFIEDSSFCRYSKTKLWIKNIKDKEQVTEEVFVDKEKQQKVDLFTKSAWYMVETFGKVFGAADKNTETVTELGLPKSITETLEQLKVDNEREYFLSGNIDSLIYDEQCVFADPFVSFQGRQRFVENLKNLNSFITKYSAKPITYNVNLENNEVTTKFMVKLELNLPWKPVLAWPWGVRCVIDPKRNVIILHEESVSFV